MAPSLPLQLDSQERAALRAAIASANASGADLAAAFYEELFRLAPGARALFPADMAAQRMKLGQTLETVIAFLDEPERLEAPLRALGKRHIEYGAFAPHYLLVGEALLHSLESAVPGGFDDSTRKAWQRLYGWMAAVMLDGAAAAT